MKKDLIDKLFEEFEKDKETIKNNLLLAMDELYLSTNDGIHKITMQIKIESIKK